MSAYSTRARERSSQERRKAEEFARACAETRVDGLSAF
jgi:hypothetical protein